VSTLRLHITDERHRDFSVSTNRHQPSQILLLKNSNRDHILRAEEIEIIEPIGKGGMGVVYKARDTTLKLDVALKGLPATFLPDPECERGPSGTVTGSSALARKIVPAARAFRGDRVQVVGTKQPA
jgi:serine/threonine protein kinase